MFGKRRKKHQEEQEQQRAGWMIYNFGSDLEFAECTLCGAEHPYDLRYPDKCPKCGTRMETTYLADEVDLGNY
jgi:predicted Zn-ribbon and HTH transcriptional regulator